MKHWYRYECVEEARKDELCKFFRRQKAQYESGGPGKRKLFGRPCISDMYQGPVYYVAAFLDDDELAKANAWLQTH